MATKNTRDNTYYSFTKAFRFSSIAVLIIPVLYLIFSIVWAIVGKEEAGWAGEAMQILGYVQAAFALLWIILNIILFIMAGNMRGIKSPLGIRLLLMLALVLALAGAIILALISFGVIRTLPDPWPIILFIGLPILQMVGYIIGAVLGKKIQKALRN